MRLVLASASPRRLDLLARIGVHPDTIVPADIDESVPRGEMPRDHALRLAREKGKAQAMEEWLFANQPALTPETVKNAAATVGSVTDYDARFAATLELVKGDIGQAVQLKVTGTPTFFMNGIRLPGLRAEFFDAAIAWELKQVQSKK